MTMRNAYVMESFYLCEIIQLKTMFSLFEIPFRLWLESKPCVPFHTISCTYDAIESEFQLDAALHIRQRQCVVRIRVHLSINKKCRFTFYGAKRPKCQFKFEWDKRKLNNNGMHRMKIEFTCNSFNFQIENLKSNLNPKTDANNFFLYYVTVIKNSFFSTWNWFSSKWKFQGPSSFF